MLLFSYKCQYRPSIRITLVHDPKRVTMSGLLQDQPPHRDCCDKAAVPRDSPDEHRAGGEPLRGLTLASHGVLEEAQKRGRLKCLRCGGSRMFFCYTCCLLVGVTPKEIPSVKVCKSLELAVWFTDKDSCRYMMLFEKNRLLYTWIDFDVGNADTLYRFFC